MRRYLVSAAAGLAALVLLAGCEVRSAGVAVAGRDDHHAYGGHVEVENGDPGYVEERPVVVERRGYVVEPEPDVVVVERPTRVVVVREAPPPIRVEKRPVAPGRDYIWIEGYYGHSGGRFVWTPGRWERRRQGHTYVNAHWVQGRDGWELQAGFWKRD